MCGAQLCSNDNVGRPAHQRIRHNGRTQYDKSYLWGDNLRLLQTLDTINRRSVRYDYDTFGSLSGAVYDDGSCQWRNPDAMGNVYDSPDRTDRSYGRGGQLREDKKWRYYYDSHGNLVLKTMRRMEPLRNAEARDEFFAWQNGDYAYTWQGNGMLRSVTRPDGKTVTFKYDALGRRIEKVFDGRVYRYLWDGDVILHEWDYAEADRPNTIVTDTGEVTLDRPEPVENLITWVYDSDSYVPTAKIVGERYYSIISDYIGHPVQSYDDNGNVVWQADYDIYGNLRNLHGSRQFIPFRQLGQYEDEETGLYYNRFRYYDPRIGNYISQDPIRLAGNNPTLYAFVTDPNLWVDVFGLEIIPNKAAGLKREGIGKEWIQKKHPNATIYSERYIRDVNGKSVKDSNSSRRRLDFVAVEDGKVVGIYEVTSPTANKTSQVLKEAEIRANGGDYIKEPGRKGKLYDISDVETKRLDVDLNTLEVTCH